MKKIFLFLLAICTLGVTAHARTRTSFDFGWKFQLGDHPDAVQPGFDDSAWRALNLPHDWSIEGTYDQNNPTGPRGGFLPAGTAWYRKSFDAPAGWPGRKVFVEFDGIYMNGEVWINGHRLGIRPYGYIGFEYDLTPHLKPGRNVIAVRVDDSKAPSGRWYTGCGIYRHTWLTVAEPVYVGHWGTFVTTPQVTPQSAGVVIKTRLQNDTAAPRTVTLRSSVLNARGAVVALVESKASLAAGARQEIAQRTAIAKPALWSPENPNLYLLRTSVLAQNRVLDEVTTTFGVRTIRFDAEKGFFLNGRPLKLKGVCNHHDAGPLGAAVPDKVLASRLLQLKEMGANAVRTSHNPFAPEFYAFCDRMGIMVMDEAFDGWKQKAEWDYGRVAFAEWWKTDLRDFVLRDRNHPSIVIWSIGNETGTKDQYGMTPFIHELDPTRPVTGGEVHEGVDVSGWNGRGGVPGFIDEWERKMPLVFTEVPHTFQTRGFYRTQTWWRDAKRPRTEIPNLTPTEIFTDDYAPEHPHTITYNSSYDNSGVRICARDSWRRTRDHAFVSGEFRWTGFDYLGESFGWPLRMGNFGIIDVCGFPKDHYYFYQSQWTEKPMVHLLPHWTHPGKEGVQIPVWAYSNAESVELFLNGKSLGEQKMAGKMNASWLVPYQSGVLRAAARRGGLVVATDTVATAGSPARLRVVTDTANLRADARDVAQVSVGLTDSNGNLVPGGSNRVYFHLDGPAIFKAVDNGDPADLEPHRQNHRKAFHGLLKAFVEATGQSGPVALTAGAILGDQTLRSIDVVTLNLRGSASRTPYSVHYTTDGSTPTPASPLYRAPFRVQPGSVVRAAVFEGRRQVLAIDK